MYRPTLVRTLLAALVAALVVLPASALGAKPEVFHSNFVDTEEGVEVCPAVVVDIVAKGAPTSCFSTRKATPPASCPPRR
jgi:hypothetical protein